MIFRGGRRPNRLGRIVTVNRGLTEAVFMPASINRIKKKKKKKNPWTGSLVTRRRSTRRIRAPPHRIRRRRAA